MMMVVVMIRSRCFQSRKMRSSHALVELIVSQDADSNLNIVSFCFVTHVVQSFDGNPSDREERLEGSR